MDEYTVYFEIFGKRMKYTTEAYNRTDAIEKVKLKLQILKVEKKINTNTIPGTGNNDIFDFFKGFRK